MRDFLDAILQSIGSASLSDSEFSALTIDVYDYDQATYDALLAVLDARESVSSMKDRLAFYFKSKGAEINPPADQGKSQIYLGAALCD